MTEKQSPACNYHFPALDGFRALSCIGIMMMCIQANTHYMLSGFVWDRLIPCYEKKYISNL